MTAFVGAASDLVDVPVPEVVKVVVLAVRNLEMAPLVVIVDFVLVIVDSVVDIADSATVIVDSKTVAINFVVVVVDFDLTLDVVDSLVVIDCMARHPRSKNDQINLIMQEFTLQMIILNRR